jgi:hypothetical protein
MLRMILYFVKTKSKKGTSGLLKQNMKNIFIDMYLDLKCISLFILRHFSN